MLFDGITETVKHETKNNNTDLFLLCLKFLAASLVQPIISSVVSVDEELTGREYMDKNFLIINLDKN